ncbi:unnamed protein product [Leuciscus chuanchicus]
MAHRSEFRVARYTSECASFTSKSCLTPPTFEEPPQPVEIPSYKWLSVVYSQDILFRLEDIKARNSANSLNFQIYLLDGLHRWNHNRAAAALEAEASGLRSYSGELVHSVNKDYEKVFGRKLIPSFTPSAKYTGELIGVQYLLRQNNEPLQCMAPDSEEANTLLEQLEEPVETDEGFEELEHIEVTLADLLLDTSDMISVLPASCAPELSGQSAPPVQSTHLLGVQHVSAPPVQSTHLLGVLSASAPPVQSTHLLGVSSASAPPFQFTHLLGVPSASAPPVQCNHLLGVQPASAAPVQSTHLLGVPSAPAPPVQSTHLLGVPSAPAPPVQSTHLLGVPSAPAPPVQSTLLLGVQPASAPPVQSTHLLVVQPASAAPVQSTHLLGVPSAPAPPVQSTHLLGVPSAPTPPVQSTHLLGVPSASAPPVQSTHLLGVPSASAPPVQSTHLLGVPSASAAPVQSTHLLGVQPASAAPVQSTHLLGVPSASAPPVQSTHLLGVPSASAPPVQSTHLLGVPSASAPPVQSTHLLGVQPASAAPVQSSHLLGVPSGLPGQSTSSEQVAVDEQSLAGMDRVDELAEYLVELRNEKASLLPISRPAPLWVFGRTWSNTIRTGFLMLLDIRRDCSLVGLGLRKRRLYLQELKAQKGVYLVLLVQLLSVQTAAVL